MKKIITFVLFVIFALLAFVLHLKNPEEVAFSFPFIEWQAPLGALMLIALLVGLVAGALLMSFSVVKSKMVKSKVTRQLAKVEKEVENLRAMPIKDEV